MKLRFIAGVITALLASGAPLQASLAAELFGVSAAASSGSGLRKPSKTIKRQRLVELDPAALADAIIPPGLDSSPDRVKRASQQSGKISLRLFDDVRVDLQRSSVDAAPEGGIVWNGESNLGDDAILVVHGGAVTGVVERNGHQYLIEPAGRGRLHRIKEIDSEAYPRDVHRTPPGKHPSRAPAAPSTEPPAAALAALTEVTLMVVTTDRAKTRLGANFQDKITLDVSRVNKSLANSGVNMKIRIVGFRSAWAGYNELASADSGQPLDAITTGTAYNFRTLRQTRNTLAADLVTFYTVRPEYCGLAWVNYPSLSAAYAYSVINADCQGTLSLAHELGHNMGLFHDRYVEAVAPNSQYNFGYVSIPGRFRDIMSYSDKCWDYAVTCSEISYYSTPLKSYSGRPVGIARYQPGAADAARLLRENTAGVARFR